MVVMPGRMDLLYSAIASTMACGMACPPQQVVQFGWSIR
jgi:hypothetical protein